MEFAAASLDKILCLRCVSPRRLQMCRGFTRFLSAHAGAVDPSDTAAPVIVIPPQNTSVVAGSSEVTLECVANARYRKSRRGVIKNQF